ncbi:hypothetical protein [Serratia ureilytica]|uniref:hypothetical protein n=1 Tax=Serratia ureilytica TaxID=300181 RepID=UPI0019200269|nr:hypothetical protein [Serratia ureilytica]MBL0880393.1 hypothetical protein [Serratia ureilytica]MDN2472651.1 hypothetical protein [Serratia ureilytica]
MRKYTMVDMPDQFRSISVLLAAAMEMDETDEYERELAFTLVDRALIRSRKLAEELERKEARNA